MSLLFGGRLVAWALRVHLADCFWGRSAVVFPGGCGGAVPGGCLVTLLICFPFFILVSLGWSLHPVMWCGCWSVLL